MISSALKFFILFCTLSKYAYVRGLDHHRHSARIIRGTDVKIKDFPYYAGLLNCGAVILSENWLATAAHCVDNHYSRELQLVTVGGESFLNSKLVVYDRVVIHNNLNYRPLMNDIALLHLTESLNFTERIRPADLPSFKDMTRSDEDNKLVFVGRGLDESRELTRNIQKMEVRRLTTEECWSYLPRNIREQIKPIVNVLEKAIVCARREEGGPGLCGGDSGSPLMQGNKLIGIASFIGTPHCEQASLGFYVNVENYVPWIRSVTGL